MFARGKVGSTSELESLVHALTAGEREVALAAVADLLRGGMHPAEIITGGVEAAMMALNRKCTAEQFNLLEVMLAGRAVMAVVHRLFPDGGTVPDPRASVVIAVLEGDVHDIGKAILKTVLGGSHYRVIDCGRDAAVPAVVSAVAESGAAALCVSGLISSVIPQVRALKPALAGAGLGQVRVLAGGAALKQCAAASLNVDYVGQTAFDAVAYLNSVAGVRHGAP